MRTFCEWAKIEENKAVKKAKITPVAHTDIDRWLKSVDGLSKDLQDLKKAKDKSQAKLDQIKKKYEPEPEKIKPEIEPDEKPEEKPEIKPVEKLNDKESPDEKQTIVRERKPKPKPEPLPRKPVNVEPRVRRKPIPKQVERDME